MNQANKEKAKAALNGAKEKAKIALSEIKTNFKADEGTEGVKKYKSMFANLWKSGTTGKATLVAASIVGLLLFKSIFLGGASDVGEGFEDSKSVDVDTLVIKGLYMRQPGDEALKACKRIASSSKNLVVVDHRKGFEYEKDEATKAAEKKEYEKKVAEAKEDVESFFKWQSYGEGGGLVKVPSNGEGSLIRGCYSVNASVFMLAAHFNYQVEWKVSVKGAGGKKYETGILAIPKQGEEEVQHFLYETMANVATFKKSIVYKKVKEKGLEMTDADPLFRLASKDVKGGVVTKEDVAKNWLVARGNHPPSDKVVIAKKNLIAIAIREEGKREYELEGLCNVWLYKDDPTVSQVFFTERGMAQIFNAGDLSTKEFAQALVTNYPDIPSLEADVKISNEANDGSMRLETYTWTYKDPRGFQVKLLDSAYYDHHGQRINLKGYGGMQNEAGVAARILASSEKRWFSITAIKPESARKFD